MYSIKEIPTPFKPGQNSGILYVNMKAYFDAWKNVRNVLQENFLYFDNVFSYFLVIDLLQFYLAKSDTRTTYSNITSGQDSNKNIINNYKLFTEKNNTIAL